MLFFGGSQSWSFLALKGKHISWQSAMELKLSTESPCPTYGIPFTGGVVGIIPYDTMSGQQDSPSFPVCFKVSKVLAFHRESKSCFLCETDFYEKADFDVNHKNFSDNQDSFWQDSPIPGLILNPMETDKSYLNKVQDVLSFIKAGRFYQLNLLRYFEVSHQPHHLDLVARYFQTPCPMGVWFKWGEQEIISFTPERLARINGQTRTLTTQPIKGTAQTPENEKTLNEEKAKLNNSVKDKAELNMIVDLLRNDMYPLSEKGSIQVESAGDVIQFGTVLHRVATIKSTLKKNLRLKDFFQALFPGGSITGAPKIEVMKAIQELENRPRSYFMGTAFYLDTFQGNMDSNILIRTLIKSDSNISYGAGSGLVIRSNPEQELQEIDAKCKVLTNPLPKKVRT